MDNRVKDGGYYDGYWDEYYETSSSDDLMNDHTKQSLQGVSTLKLGLEYKPVSMLAFYDRLCTRRRFPVMAARF